MGVLRTCCGLYCAFTALIGIYFFVILAIMEYRGNTFLVQIVQMKEGAESVQPSNNEMGTAFLITAAI